MLEVARVEKKRARWLDFTNERVSSGRYGIHEYPAMLHYLVVRNLLERFCRAELSRVKAKSEARELKRLTLKSWKRR